MKVPSFDDIGKERKDLLLGKKVGIFQYDNKLAVNLKAANGVTIAAKAIRTNAGRLDAEFKGTWTNGPVTLELLPAKPKATLKVAKTVAPGLSLTLSDEFPNPHRNGKATIEYFQPHVTSKFVVGLNSNVPVEANACVGWNGFVAGGKANVDVRNSRVSNYSLACAYLGPGFTATGHTTEKFGKITGTYWQKIDALSAIAAEVVHEPSSNDVALTMGYQHIEPDGTLNKMKISSKGAVQLHRDVKLARASTLGISMSLNALDTSQVPDIGISFDHSP